MPKLLLLGVLLACLSGPTWLHAEDDAAPQIATPQTVDALRRTISQNKVRIAALEIRLADNSALLARALKRIEALEQAVKAGGVASRGVGTGVTPPDQTAETGTTEVYSLDRKHLLKHMLLMVTKDTDESLAGKSAAEAKRLRKNLNDDLRKQINAMDLRLVLRDNRSMKMLRTSELSSGVETGLWSRSGNRLILTITHKGLKPLKQPNLIEGAFDGDDLELAGNEFPFPIRMRRTK